MSCTNTQIDINSYINIVTLPSVKRFLGCYQLCLQNTPNIKCKKNSKTIKDLTNSILDFLLYNKWLSHFLCISC